MRTLSSRSILEKLDSRIVPIVKNIYIYGSQVYNTAKPNADHDVIVIADNHVTNGETTIGAWGIDITVYSIETFQKMIDEHDPIALECFFAPAEFRIEEEHKFSFTLNLHKLRESFSQKSSNSYVKCNKKLSVEKDFNEYIGKKSLFHSFRILLFGIQIAQQGRIVDFSQANFLYQEIMNNKSIQWEDYKIKYQPFYNSIKSQFRACCPK